MAVCGRCWLCGDKFDCNELKGCQDCSAPARVELQNDGRENGRGGEFVSICVECVRAIDSGAVGSLVHALRAARS